MAFVVNEVVTNFVANLDGLFAQLDGLTAKLDTMSQRTFKVRFEADNAGLTRTLKDINDNVQSMKTTLINTQKLILGGISTVSTRVRDTVGGGQQMLGRAVKSSRDQIQKGAKDTEFTLIDAAENFVSQAIHSFLRFGSTVTFLAFTVFPTFVQEMANTSDSFVESMFRMVGTIPAVWGPVFGWTITEAAVTAGAVEEIAKQTIFGVLQGHLDDGIQMVSDATSKALVFLGALAAPFADVLGQAFNTLLGVVGVGLANFSANIIEATTVIFTFGQGVNQATTFMGQLALTLGVVGQLSLALVGFNVVTGFLINRIRGFISGVQPNTVLGKASVLINVIFDGLVKIATPASLIINRFASAVGLISLASGLVLQLATGVGTVGTMLFTVIGVMGVIRPLVTNLFKAVNVRFLQLRAAFGDGRAQMTLMLRGAREGFAVFSRFGRELSKLGKSFSLVKVMKNVFNIIKSIRDQMVRMVSILTFGSTGVEQLGTGANQVLGATTAINAEMDQMSAKTTKTAKDFDDGAKLGEKAVFGLISATKTIATMLPNFALNFTSILGAGLLIGIKKSFVVGANRLLDGVFGPGTTELYAKGMKDMFDKVRKHVKTNFVVAVGRSFFALFTTKTKDLGKKMRAIWAPNRAKKAGKIIEDNKKKLQSLSNQQQKIQDDQRSVDQMAKNRLKVFTRERDKQQAIHDVAKKTMDLRVAEFNAAKKVFEADEKTLASVKKTSRKKGIDAKEALLVAGAAKKEAQTRLNIANGQMKKEAGLLAKLMDTAHMYGVLSESEKQRVKMAEERWKVANKAAASHKEDVEAAKLQVIEAKVLSSTNRKNLEAAEKAVELSRKEAVLALILKKRQEDVLAPVKEALQIEKDRIVALEARNKKFKDNIERSRQQNMTLIKFHTELLETEKKRVAVVERRQLKAIANVTTAKQNEFVGDKDSARTLARLRKDNVDKRAKDVDKILNTELAGSEKLKSEAIGDLRERGDFSDKEMVRLHKKLTTLFGRDAMAELIGSRGGQRNFAKLMLGDPEKIIERLGKDERTIKKFLKGNIKQFERVFLQEIDNLNKSFDSKVLHDNARLVVNIKKSLLSTSQEIKTEIDKEVDFIKANFAGRITKGDAGPQAIKEFILRIQKSIAGGDTVDKTQKVIVEWMKKLFGKDTFKKMSKGAIDAFAVEMQRIVQEGAAPYMKPGSDPKHPKGLKLIKWLTTLGSMAAKKFGETMRVDLGREMKGVTQKQGQEVGKMMGKGLKDGEKHVKKGASSVAKVIKDHFPASPPLLGPLKGDFLVKAGGRIVQMLSLGILSNKGLLAGAVGRTMQFAFAPLFGPAGMLISGVVMATKSIFNLKFAFQSLADNSVIRAMTETADKVAQIGRQAARTVGAENVAEYDAFRLAMAQQKVEATQLETIFTQLNRRIAEASSGNVEAAAFFQEIGVSIEDVKDGTVLLTDVFFALQDAYAQNEGNLEKQQKIIDAAGATMLDMRSAFVGGSEDIQEAMKDLRESGLVIQPKDVHNAEAYEKAWIRLKQIVNGIQRQLMDEFFPTAEGFFTGALDWWKKFHDPIIRGIRAFGGLIATLFELLFERFGEWIKTPARFFDEALDVFRFAIRSASVIAFAFWNNIIPVGIAAFKAIFSVVKPLWQTIGQVIIEDILPKMSITMMRPVVEFFDNIPAVLIGTFQWFLNLLGSTFRRVVFNLNVWGRDIEFALLGVAANIASFVDKDAERSTRRAQGRVLNARMEAQIALNEAIRDSELGIDFFVQKQVESAERLTAAFFDDWERNLDKAAAGIGAGLDLATENAGKEILAELHGLGVALNNAVGDAVPGLKDAFGKLVKDLEISPDGIARVKKQLEELRKAAADAMGTGQAEQRGIEILDFGMDAISLHEDLQKQIVTTEAAMDRYSALTIQRLRESTEAASQYNSALGSVRDLQTQLADTAIEAAGDQNIFDKMFGDVDVQSLKLQKLEIELRGKLSAIKQQFAETTVELRERVFDVNEQINKARRAGDEGLVTILQARLQVLMAAEMSLGDQQIKIIEQIKEATEKAKEAIKLEPFEGLGETVGGAISEGLNQALTDTIAGKELDFKKVVGGMFGTIQKELGKSFIDSTVKNLQGSMTKMFSEVFSFAGDLAGDLANGVLFVVSSLLATSEQEIASVQESIDTMVESTEKVRGIISGETTVALKEVQDNMRDAMIPTNNILEGIRSDLSRGRGTLAAEAGGTSAS